MPLTLLTTVCVRHVCLDSMHHDGHISAAHYACKGKLVVVNNIYPLLMKEITPPHTF